MVASWEIKAQRQVLCAVLHVDTTTIAWAFGLRNLQIPGGVTGLTGMPYDMGRNVACQQCLDGGFQWLFFLDSDVVPPNDAIYRLLRHNKPLISGLYCRRSPPVGVPVMIRGGQWVTEFQANSVVEVDWVGAGCLLIHRSVLEQMKPYRENKRWFSWQVDLKGTGIVPEGECISEDFAFCQNVKRQLGIPTLVDTSVQCRHIGLAQSSYAAFGPLDTTPVT